MTRLLALKDVMLEGKDFVLADLYAKAFMKVIDQLHEKHGRLHMMPMVAALNSIMVSMIMGAKEPEAVARTVRDNFDATLRNYLTDGYALFGVEEVRNQ